MRKVKIVAKVKRIEKIIEEHGDEFYLLDEPNNIYLITSTDESDPWRGFINQEEASVVEI